MENRSEYCGEYEEPEFTFASRFDEKPDAAPAPAPEETPSVTPEPPRDRQPEPVVAEAPQTTTGRNASTESAARDGTWRPTAHLSPKLH